MVAPSIKSNLESNFFVNQPADVKARLDQCLAVDFLHIIGGKRDEFSTEGKAVTALQDALRKIRKEILASLPDITDAPGDYGGTTKNAVLSYKSDVSHVIVRQGQRVDDVVGRMTLTQLDNDMLTIEGKKPPPPPTPPTPSATQDVYVKINGFDNPNQQGRNLSASPEALLFATEINSQPGYLESHTPLTTLWFVGGQNPNPTETIVSKIEELSKLEFLPMGKVMISGGSAGGKNVLQVATRLQGLGIATAYVAIWDGAFQRDDLTDPTQFDNNDNFDRFKPATLNFKGAPGKGFRENFFQSWGHCLDKSQEVHGSVVGFEVRDLTNDPDVEKVKKIFESNIFKTGSDKQKALENAHKAAFFKGRNSAEGTVRKLLKPPPTN